MIGTGDVVRQMLSNMGSDGVPSMGGIQVRHPPEDEPLEIDIGSLSIEDRQSIENKIDIWVQEINKEMLVEEPSLEEIHEGWDDVNKSGEFAHVGNSKSPGRRN